MSSRIEKSVGFDEAIERWLKRTVKNRAEFAQEQAKELCPVDTGTLKDSIRIVYADDGTTAKVGSDVDYCQYVEYGTSKQSPKAFLRRAYMLMVARFAKK